MVVALMHLGSWWLHSLRTGRIATKKGLGGVLSKVDLAYQLLA
jgi:hypothetical protein